jgi:hypothetical protein
VAENIERGAGDVTRTKSFEQRSVVDQLAARAVDDAHVLLHGGQGAGVDDARGLRGQAHVQAEKVGFGEKLFDRAEANSVFARNGLRNERIMPQKFHTKRFGAARDFHAHAAQAKNAKLLAPQFSALQ